MNSVQDLPYGRGFPIRTSADQRSLASPRGFSQRATSFIASWRQGIHRTPFCHSISLPPPPARRTKAHRTSGEQFTEALAQSLTLIHSITCSLRHVAFQTVRAASWQPKGCRHTSWPLRRARSYSPCKRTPLPVPPPAGLPSPGSAASRGHGLNRVGFHCSHRLRHGLGRGHRPAPWPRVQPADGFGGGRRCLGSAIPPCSMEAIGFEPTTPCLQSRRSPN